MLTGGLLGAIEGPNVVDPVFVPPVVMYGVVILVLLDGRLDCRCKTEDGCVPVVRNPPSLLSSFGVVDLDIDSAAGVGSSCASLVLIRFSRLRFIWYGFETMDPRTFPAAVFPMLEGK